VMNWKGFGRKRSWPIEVISGHMAAGTREKTYNKKVRLGEPVSRNREPPEYKSKVSLRDQPALCQNA
jgi:hypothetical protein